MIADGGSTSEPSRNGTNDYVLNCVCHRVHKSPVSLYWLWRAVMESVDCWPLVSIFISRHLGACTCQYPSLEM
jgi:hypothetical protein